MELKGNTILITGGSSGIGLAFAEAFLSLGNTVIICGRRQDRLEKLAQQYPGLVTYKADIGSRKDREQLTKSVIEQHPNVNILLNNAGVQYYNNLIKDFDLDKATEEVSINLLGPLHLAALFYTPSDVAEKGGYHQHHQWTGVCPNLLHASLLRHQSRLALRYPIAKASANGYIS